MNTLSMYPSLCCYLACCCIALPPLLAKARYSSMPCLWLLSILSREMGMGTVQKKSWFNALSASSLLVGSREINLSDNRQKHPIRILNKIKSVINIMFYLDIWF